MKPTAKPKEDTRLKADEIPGQKAEIKTEGPLSEKDEVKNAEVRTRKATKEHHLKHK